MADELTGRLTRPTPLYERAGRGIYWLGIAEETAFRCNAYFLKDGEVGILFDPGSRPHFAAIRARVAQIMPPERVAGMVLCHQDPDVAASMVDWLDVNPDMWVFATPRAQVLIPYYGCRDFRWWDVEDRPEYHFPSGEHLRFIPAPFMHFAGASVTWDSGSRFLFSGDVWAALDLEWRLWVDDFTEHEAKMDLFHLEYMCSGVAARGLVKRLEGLPIDSILPQHGSLMRPQHVAAALDYLRRLRCGTDIIYANL